MISRAQLLELGFTPDAIKHRIAIGRLHPKWRGVYAVGRPELTLEGTWSAALLACGPLSVLSHETAAMLWGLAPPRHGRVKVSVPTSVARRRSGIEVHRRSTLPVRHVTHRNRLRVTTPILTLVDLAPRLDRNQLERATNEADKRDLTNPESLRAALDHLAGNPGVATLRKVLDRRTITLTDSELERRFLPIARRAGLPKPLTGEAVNGFNVDFYWPDLGLVVETDGLRYHRTPAQQARDRVRDQAHAAAGLTPVRFTRAQVRFEPADVEATLTAVASRLRAS